MPLYDFRCPASHTFRRLVRLADFDDPQACPECGEVAQRIISAPAIRGDYQGYSCPITGNWIEGRRAHQENLKRHGCRVLEPGETSAAASYRASEETKLDNEIDETVDRFIEALPATKREQLAAELSNGADATVVRQ